MYIIKIVIILIFVSFSNLLFAQEVQFSNEFKKSLRLLDSATFNNDYFKAAKSFEKTALIDKKNWLTFYYAGICNTLLAFDKKGKDIDIYCDKAEKYANIADSLNKDNSEIYVLKSMIVAARINVNVLQRGQKYGALSAKYNIKALSLNSNNPRAYLQKAKTILKMPLSIGGGEKKAKASFELAVEKFKLFKAETIYHPNWGQKEAIAELKKIK